MTTLQQIIAEKKEQLKSLNNTIIAQSIIKETEKALLLDLFNISKMEDFNMWVPKSVVESQNKINDAIEITFASWFFEKNGGKFLSTVEF